MKRSILPLAFWLSLFLTLPAHGDTLEYRIAVIGSGAMIPETDSSVKRARYLLSEVATVYKITQQDGGKFSVFVRDELKKSGVEVNVLDVLDGSLIAAANPSQMKNVFQEYAAMYIVIRRDGELTHHQAVRGYVGSQVTMINARAKR